tara:strand:+ start:3004 stop:3972 length:969 start_codon:yes stop_codon:yes gene_type:complete
MGFWGSKTLLSAAELGLFTVLADGAQDVEGLSQRLGLHQRGARDFFDSLVALGMLRREGRQYANTPEAGLYLDRAKPSYIGGILEMANARLYGYWGSLTEALRTGRPQNEAKTGGNAFDAIYKDPASLRGFLQAMTGVSMAANMAIAQKFSWSNYRSFIDVGTAQGGLAVQIALAQGHLSGGGFDLPVVAPIFEEYVASFGLARRLSFYPGDFFKDQLPETDVLLMGHVLHDWSVDEKRMLIAKAYDALNPAGALIVYDAVIDDGRSRNAFGLLMSLNMLIETQAGFDYTGADCQSWLRDAGFHDTYVEHLVGPDSMVVGIK